jgi:hypothetical protein
MLTSLLIDDSRSYGSIVFVFQRLTVQEHNSPSGGSTDRSAVGFNSQVALFGIATVPVVRYQHAVTRIE